MLPWKLRKCQILPVNQNLSSVYFSYAKFQLVSCDPSLAIIWQMTYTHKLPKLCSATLTALGISSLSYLARHTLRRGAAVHRLILPGAGKKKPFIKMILGVESTTDMSRNDLSAFSTGVVLLGKIFPRRLCLAR